VPVGVVVVMLVKVGAVTSPLMISCVTPGDCELPMLVVISVATALYSWKPVVRLVEGRHDQLPLPSTAMPAWSSEGPS
jgi:hypothetical protein